MNKTNAKAIYCGTYGKGDGNGIYRVRFSDGVLSDPELICRCDSTKYIAESPYGILSVFADKSGAGIQLLDHDGRIIDRVVYEQIPSCYVGVQGNVVYAANYHEGTFSTFEITADSISLKKRISIREKAGCHMLLPYKGQLLGFALNMERIYVFDQDVEETMEIVFDPGTGPRHGVLSDDEKYLFVVSELSNELFAFSTADFSLIDLIKITDSGSSAAIRFDNGRIYASTRGQNLISVFSFENEKLRMLQQYDCGGSHPRDMIVTDGYVICANLDSDSLCCLKDGKLVSRISIPQAVTVTA